MKDLMTLQELDKLIAAGVDSFKIEGRMKSPSYVYTTTKLYKETRDNYLKTKKIVINKKDQGQINDVEGIGISAKNHDIEPLIQKIKEMFELGKITSSQDDILANARQIQLLERANQSLKNAIEAMEQSIPTDLIVTDLYDSWESLKEILGERAKEDLLDELFKRFCIGK